MSGTGKELAGHRYKAVDADYNGLSQLVSTPPSSDRSGLGAEQDWIATASNQAKFYGQFDHVVLLTAPASVMTDRLVRRTSNPYGKDPNEPARALALKR